MNKRANNTKGIERKKKVGIKIKTMTKKKSGNLRHEMKKK